MNFPQKIVSYLFPSTRKITSDYNGDLAVTVFDGHKVLDSANANYSYGALQQVLKFALDKIYSPHVANILVLGLGGGSVVATLRQDFGFAGQLTAVDIDPVIIQIAQEEFGIAPSANTRIECADAFEFVKWEPERYDLIIVDLFIDTEIPDPFLSAEFWQNIRPLVRDGGAIIFNTISETTKPNAVKNELTALGFAVQEYPDVNQTNTILIATVGGTPGPRPGE